jgi:putative ABC transport system permease protein
MRLSTLFQEAVTSARVRKVSTAMTAVLVGAMCVTTLLTVGRTAAGEEQVAARLNDAGSRHLQVTDVKDIGFVTPSAVRLIDGYSSVERVVGVGLPVDVANSAIGDGGDRVPAWGIQGELSDAVELASGRMPEPGEALVSRDALSILGLTSAAGSVSAGRGAITYPIVGSFQSRAPYGDFDAGVVIAAADGEPSHTLDIVIRNSSESAATETAVLALLSREDLTDLSVASPRTLADVQQAVLGDLGATGRSLLLVVLVGGAGLIAVVALSDVLLQRSDLGRRRALGAPRWVVVALVVIRTGVAALVGAVLGCAIGLVSLALAGQLPEISFIVGTGVLAFLAAVLAAFPPALYASLQDPVRVLRTP